MSVPTDGARIPVLMLAPPERLGRAAERAPAIDARTASALAIAVNETLSADPTGRGLERVLLQLSAALGLSTRWRETPNAARADAAWERNDLYFGVTRERAASPFTLLVHGLTRTAASIAPFLASSSLALVERHQVLRPLTRAAVIFGDTGEMGLAPRASEPADVALPIDTLGRQDYLICQWLLGHQDLLRHRSAAHRRHGQVAVGARGAGLGHGQRRAADAAGAPAVVRRGHEPGG